MYYYIFIYLCIKICIYSNSQERNTCVTCLSSDTRHAAEEEEEERGRRRRREGEREAEKEREEETCVTCLSFDTLLRRRRRR